MTFKRHALVWSAIFLFIVGFTLHIHQLFAMSATMVALPLLARLLGRGKLRGLMTRRRVSKAAVAGERVKVDLEVYNTARTRKIFFIATETLGRLRPSQVDLPVAILGPGDHTTLSYEVRPPRRGVYPIGPTTLWTPDVIGLNYYRRELPQVNELIVYPQAAMLPYLWPSAEGGRQPIKPRRRLRGEGDDLYGVRDYQPGDDPRRISWKTTARRGKLAVVEYERPESLEGVIILDLDRRWHAGEGDRHTLEYAVTIAATLIEQAYERGSTVGLIVKGEQDWSCAPLPETEQRLRLFEALARVQPWVQDPLTQIVAANERLIPPGATVAVLSPSPDAGDLGAHLRGLGHAVTWFLLDSGSFGGGRVDYAPLESMLLGSRCHLRRIQGDRPLEANWRRGGTARAAGGGSHATG